MGANVRYGFDIWIANHYTHMHYGYRQFLIKSKKD